MNTTWLDPIPGLQRRDPEHRYWLGDHLFPVSITGVLQVAKSSYALARIEASRPVWEPRGNTCHLALELFLAGRYRQDGDVDLAEVLNRLTSEEDFLDYREWIEPLISHERWDEVEVLASERATCCLVRNVAGTFDVAFVDLQLPVSGGRPAGVSGPARVLADLKSLSASGSTYCTRAQIGGYMALEWSHGHWYDYGQTLWCRPGRSQFSPLYSRSECLSAWAAAWAHYAGHYRPF
ncbi:hypothetical protein KBY75_07760 [Cyanobium sp. T1G-Tous]|uniref:hypothetical protein n=1 Tax=unclassified Cyanobium TaxID=2627006 RepID=UPI0020CDD9F7|nr:MULTISPECIES: hypothetical protein [unclassified Cyanobium]MCP9803460.1 hypothetical protein [Cyanobium sp. T1G-Tous]MCP9807787.1 hypothetical protein [Cyanobium sp. T1B-Tous]MCP9875819.1 hypothetical protein [Cyanobium sp. A2C-AMD]